MNPFEPKKSKARPRTSKAKLSNLAQRGLVKIDPIVVAAEARLLQMKNNKLMAALDRVENERRAQVAKMELAKARKQEREQRAKLKESLKETHDYLSALEAIHESLGTPVGKTAT